MCPGSCILTAELEAGLSEAELSLQCEVCGGGGDLDLLRMQHHTQLVTHVTGGFSQ